MFHMLFPEPFRGISGGLRRSGSAWRRVSRGRPGGSVCARPSLPQCLWRTRKSRQCGDGDRDIQNGTDLLRMGMRQPAPTFKIGGLCLWVFFPFYDFVDFCFPASLLFCLFTFCFSAFPCCSALMFLCFFASLLLHFSASVLLRFIASSLLCFSTFLLLCFFASLLLHFSASVLLCFSTVLLLLFAFLVFCFSLLLCFFASWTQTNSKTNPK